MNGKGDIRIEKERWIMKCVEKGAKSDKLLKSEGRRKI